MQRLIRIGPVVHVARRRAGVKCGRLGQKPLVKAVQGWWLVAWGLLVAGGAAGLLAVLCLVAVDLASGGFFVGGGGSYALLGRKSAQALSRIRLQTLHRPGTRTAFHTSTSGPQ
jgi:hypothetical protein